VLGFLRNLRRNRVQRGTASCHAKLWVSLRTVSIRPRDRLSSVLGDEMSIWGPYGSEEARTNTRGFWRSARSAGKSRSQNRDRLCRDTVDPSMTLSEVLLRYREFAKGYYSKDGEPTKEFVEMAIALKPLRELYGATLAREFGPLKLQVVRQHMIDKDLSRGVVNHRVNRIKRFIKWATSQQLVPPRCSLGSRPLPVSAGAGRLRVRQIRLRRSRISTLRRRFHTRLRRWRR
jgi:hypothetical protein